MPCFVGLQQRDIVQHQGNRMHRICCKEHRYVTRH
jgi:hypothetical protein